MSKYNARLTEPSTSDKSWIKSTKGGYNYCIEIKNGSCLPNCVGYAWGRWRELLGKYHNLSRGNAENWYGNTGDGYKRGSTPKLGAVICWRKGKAGNSNDGAGHVAIVEKINSDGSILISESGYNSYRFKTRTLNKSNNYFYVSSSYVFQGFIYLPIEFEEEVAKPTKSVEEVAKEVIDGKWGNGEERKTKLRAAGYSYTAVQTKVNELLVKPKTVTYTVQKGDNLTKIAKKYNTTVDKIAKDNNIKDPNKIYVGQKLVIK